jgi:NAD(P)-dependent dehydrogenase (short-subunit alcohol dehydrogenase family)
VSTKRKALITGGTRGIGLGIARALAQDGWDLGLCGVRPPETVAQTLDDLRGEGGSVDYWQCDVAQPDDRRALVDAVKARFGAVNALVNNAGRAPRVRADLLDASEESFDEVVRTNLQGPYFLTQAIARDQLAERSNDPAFRAAIVFVTSISAEAASINRGEYCVSKAGLSMAARLFAVRLAAAGIAVYEVRPGIIDTDMTAAVRDAYTRRIDEGLVPERRWGHPDDIGRVVQSLVRGDLPYATGSVINVDGGLSMPTL